MQKEKTGRDRKREGKTKRQKNSERKREKESTMTIHKVCVLFMYLKQFLSIPFREINAVISQRKCFNRINKMDLLTMIKMLGAIFKEN